MSDTVFILGAGASKQAGAPVVADFLDAAERLLRQRAGLKRLGWEEDFELVARGRAALDAVHAKSYLDADDLEVVFGAFDMAALFGQSLGPLSAEEVARLPNAIRQVIIRTLEELIVFPVRQYNDGRNPVISAPAPYSQFNDIARGMLDRRQDFSILTFNYDLALDFAFHRENIQIDYGLIDTLDRKYLDPSKPYVQVLKLHGSLNWLPCKNPECGGTVPVTFKDYDPHKMLWHQVGRDEGGERLRWSGLLNHCPRCRHDAGTPRPVIVPPTWNKSHAGLASVWRHAAQQLRGARRVIVIGYSLPPIDQFFRYLYALGSVGETRLELFLVVNPDAAAESKFQHLLGPGVARRYMFRQWRFSEGMTHLANLVLEGKDWLPAVQPGLVK